MTKVAEFHNEYAQENEYDRVIKQKVLDTMRYYEENKGKMSRISGIAVNVKQKVIETREPEIMEGQSGEPVF